MPSTDTSQRTALRLIRETLPLGEDPGPEGFLARGRGEPRGYWQAEEGRWVAWRGALRVLEPTAPNGRSFHAAGDAAALLSSGPGEESPRFHGGFAFRDDHRPDGAWAGFPAWRFVLPRLELERTSNGVLLRIQALLPEGGDGEELRPRLRLLGQDLQRSLFESGVVAPPRGLNGGPPVERVREDRRAFLHGVEAVLEAIRAGRLHKAVLARTLDVELTAPADPVEVLRRLRSQNPSEHLFLMEPAPGRVLLGAAPEVVARLRGRDFHCTAVAGSAPRGADPDEDRRRGQGLLSSQKDREEHDLTLEQIRSALGPRVEGPLEWDPEPRLLVLPRIQHLQTRIRGRVRSGESVLSLLSVLHPTPAVCGHPRDAALDLLGRLENFHRGWYAGPVGWFDGTGNGEFVPALRSAVGSGRRWRLFAGAGIVPGSHPELEWEETAMKLQPALRALADPGS